MFPRWLFGPLPSSPCVRSLLLVVSSPPARFGRTWGLTRGIYGSALGALGDGGWAFLLPACLSSWLALSGYVRVLDLCALGGVRLVLRSFRSVAALPFSFYFLLVEWQPVERAWAGTGEWAGTTNPVAAAVSAAAAHFPFEIPTICITTQQSRPLDGAGAGAI